MYIDTGNLQSHKNNWQLRHKVKPFWYIWMAILCSTRKALLGLMTFQTFLFIVILFLSQVVYYLYFCHMRVWTSLKLPSVKRGLDCWIYPFPITSNVSIRTLSYFNKHDWHILDTFLTTFFQYSMPLRSSLIPFFWCTIDHSTVLSSAFETLTTFLKHPELQNKFEPCKSRRLWDEWESF